MFDQKIDEQLRRLSRAIVDTSPEPPLLTPGSARPANPWAIRASVVGFAVALTIGLVTVLLVGPWGSGPQELTAPGTIGGDGRWDWIVEHSDPTPEEGIRVADPLATPAPSFDYSDLGVEQRLVSADPMHPTFNLLGVITNSTPIVYVGTVEGTGVEGSPTNAYVFREADELTAQTMLCFSIVAPLGARTGCHEPDEATSSGQIISGTASAFEANPPGISLPDLTVDFWLPLDTALVVLKLDDGRSFVQRPIAGIAVIEIQDLGDAGIEYAEALDASGGVIVHEDFQIQWEGMVASLDSDSPTVTAGADPAVAFAELAKTRLTEMGSAAALMPNGSGLGLRVLEALWSDRDE